MRNNETNSHSSRRISLASAPSVAIFLNQVIPVSCGELHRHRTWPCIVFAVMAFNYSSCIHCGRVWSPKDRLSSEWHRVRDWECQRWLCYRCANRLWRQAHTLINCSQEIEVRLQEREFFCDVQALLAQHKETNSSCSMSAEATSGATSTHSSCSMSEGATSGASSQRAEDEDVHMENNKDLDNPHLDMEL